jgi:N-acyl-D-amino-acid deacylase
MHDLIIRGGTLIDGSGAPRRLGDLAIDGGLITAVGLVTGHGREELDARGLIVTPGFVDMHTHYDGQATWDPHCTPSGEHGVTTVIMGNCGVGFAPVREADREWLILTMEGVEDIPGSALSEGIQWAWESFAEYLDALERLPRSIDIATQVPHAALRGYVMGPQAAEQGQATDAQLQEMRQLVVDALRAGALGVSTSRTPIHKTAEGVHMAGTHAEVRELLTLAGGIPEAGHGVFELALNHREVPQDMDWLRELARITGQPVLFNLSQIDELPELWREDVRLMEAAQAEGLPLYAQVAGRGIGILQSWRSTVNPFRLCSTYAAIAGLPWEEQLTHLRDPDFRATLTEEEPFSFGALEDFVTRAFHRMWALGDNEYEPHPDQSIAARAARMGVNPAALAYDILMEDDGAGFLYFPLFNYAQGSLDVLHTLHSHPGTRMGLSDGGAHVGTICDGGMPTFMLSHWARDRARGPKMPLEWLVHRQTRQTAELYGLRDRGLLAPGHRADVNLIDLDRLRLTAPRVVADLPAGGVRLRQGAEGYVATICAGQITWREGQPTGALPGVVVRGPQRPR